MSLLDDPGVSDAERAFADEYIRNGFVASAAYAATAGKRVKPKSARDGGCQWLKKDSVRQYLRQRLGELATDAELSQQELIRYSRRVVRMGLGDLPVRRSAVSKDGQTAEMMVFEPNLPAANQATAFLGKVLGIGTAGDEKTVNLVVHDGKDLDAEIERLLNKASEGAG